MKDHLRRTFRAESRITGRFGRTSPLLEVRDCTVLSGEFMPRGDRDVIDAVIEVRGLPWDRGTRPGVPSIAGRCDA